MGLSCLWGREDHRSVLPGVPAAESRCRKLGIGFIHLLAHLNFGCVLIPSSDNMTDVLLSHPDRVQYLTAWSGFVSAIIILQLSTSHILVFNQYHNGFKSERFSRDLQTQLR